jgi:2-oxoglutarate/2-oxoacid ferredoxin oxidoreductase subunit alpha
MRRGYLAGSQFTDIEIVMENNESVKNDILLSGAESVALGALAGGCNYVCGYPMSPSTSVLEKMAFYSGKFDIIVEQVEDEVGVVNMALGAWYAGARAFVTTSGGGFALMCEGISLCGMIESPLVIHLAQRPGPATGLPTRTEQGDLNLALYAGHGDFPRIILAPGTLDEGYRLTQAAFELSDRYQVPVFILTDQYFVDSRYNTIPFTVTKLPENQIVETDAVYKRFALTENGVSPRGIPGHGSGVVCADSDEHDESGHITEDLDLRVKMVDKRLRKEVLIKDVAIEPVFIGNNSYSTLVICWGSTFHIVNDAVRSLDNDEIGVLHYSWIYPLSKNTSAYLEKASKVIIVENNATSQFAQLIQRETGYAIKNKILKYNGLPFTIEEVALKIRSLV